MTYHSSGRGEKWEVRASALSLLTKNPIRDIFENLQVKPNPNKKTIPLSVGDPTWFGNLKPPQNIIKAVNDCLELNESRTYAFSNGHVEARQAVAEYSAYQGKVTAEDVILCSGCSHAMEMVVAVLAESGKNILIPRPGYLLCYTVGEGLGIQIKYYDLLPHQNWIVDLESLEKGIDENTAAIVVNNPSNPCGSVYTKKHLLDILDIAYRHRVPIIADEVYEHFVFSGYEYTAISSLSNDVPVLTCSGLTKRFLVPGWRMGWIIIHDRHDILAEEVRKGLLNMSTRILGPNTLIQRALPSILKDTPESFFKETMDFIESQAKMACEMLQDAPGLQPIMPQGSMYLMIEINISLFTNISDDLEFIKLLYSEQSVLCIPGQCFNYPNFMRIVLTVPKDILLEACQRILLFCVEHVDISDKKNEVEDTVQTTK